MQSCGWAGAVWGRAGAVMWLGRGSFAQKSLFHSISRHPNFRVTDLQLNLALTDYKGLTNLICYRRNSVIANIRNKKKTVEGTVILHPL